VPLDAVIDSGESARVYVERGEGIFEPRQVQTGWRTGDRVEILHGVQPGEHVVVSATFLVDSESRLKSPDQAKSTLTEAAPNHASREVAEEKSAQHPVGSMKHQGLGND